MVAIDTTILLQMFTECKHARRYDWNYRKHEETEDTVPILKEPHSEIPEIKKKLKWQPQKRGKWQIQSDMSNLSLLVNPLHWTGLTVGFERMSRILTDVKGKKGHPDGESVMTRKTWRKEL